MHVPTFERSPYFFVVLFSIVAGILSVAILLRRRKMAWREIGLSTLLTTVCLASFSAMGSYLRAGNLHDCGFDGVSAIAGLVFGLGFSLWLFPRHNDELIEAWSISTPLMYGLSKIACHLAGCCHGFSYDGSLVVYYGDSEVGYFPVQLLEAAVFCALFLALLIASKRLRARQTMRLAVWFSLVAKFFLDFLRDTHTESFLSFNQCALIVLALGFICFCGADKCKKTKNIVK